MILKIDGWIFDVDLTTTMVYSSKEAKEHCVCAYCRNFYASVDSAYPELRPFLARFGMDIEAPDELIPYFPPTECTAFYAVGGKIVVQGHGPIQAGELKVFPELTEEAMVNTFIQGPHFFLSTDMMHLPWVLEEPMEDAVSPANDPSNLKRIFDKLLRKALKGTVQ